MYEAHFGFNKRPFSLSPDTGLFVNLADHDRCFKLLQHVIDSGEGFLKVVGDVGTGKTILCRKLLRYLDSEQSEKFHSVYIPNPMLSPIGLYRAVGQELGLSVDKQKDNDALHSHITDRILALAESNQQVVIVVDESQSLPALTLEALRLITNLETEDKKLVQVILFGQTELDTLLNQDRFRQLRQRITFSHYLQPMNADETRQYIEFRLAQSGYNGAPLFDLRAIKKLHRLSAGIPRMINVIAHKALIQAYAERQSQVTKKHLHIAASDSQISQAKPRLASWLTAAASLVLVASLVWRLV